MSGERRPRYLKKDKRRRRPPQNAMTKAVSSPVGAPPRRRKEVGDSPYMPPCNDIGFAHFYLKKTNLVWAGLRLIHHHQKRRKKLRFRCGFWQCGVAAFRTPLRTRKATFRPPRGLSSLRLHHDGRASSRSARLGGDFPERNDHRCGGHGRPASAGSAQLCASL